MSIQALMFPKRGKRKNEKLENVMFIDPGLDGTGWAFFEWLVINGKRNALSPHSSGSFKPKSSVHWQTKAEEVWSWFEGHCATYQIKVLVIESPEAWLGDAIGLASIQRGDIFKLMYLIGGLADVARRRGIRVPVMISPREWKGQLPKDVTKKRVKRAFDNKKWCPQTSTTHEFDAVGMGLAAQGGM